MVIDETPSDQSGGGRAIAACWFGAGCFRPRCRFLHPAAAARAARWASLWALEAGEHPPPGCPRDALAGPGLCRLDVGASQRMCPGASFFFEKRACEKKGIGSSGLVGGPLAGGCAQDTLAGGSGGPAEALSRLFDEALAKMQGMLDCAMVQADRKNMEIKARDEERAVVAALSQSVDKLAQGLEHGRHQFALLNATVSRLDDAFADISNDRGHERVEARSQLEHLQRNMDALGVSLGEVQNAHELLARVVQARAGVACKEGW